MKLKLGAKITIYIVLLFIVAGTIGSIINYLVSNKLLQSVGEDYNQQILQNNLGKINKLENYINFSFYLSKDPVLRSFVENENDREYHSFVEKIIENSKMVFGNSYPFVASNITKNHYSMNKSGKLSNPRKLTKSNGNDHWYFDTLKKGYNVNIDVEETISAEKHVFINVPIEEKGKIKGVTGVGINITDLINSLTSDLEKHSEIIIFDDNGSITVHKDLSLISNSSDGGYLVFDLFSENDANSIRENMGNIMDTNDLEQSSLEYNGQKYISSMVRVDYLKWNIMVLTSVDFISKRLFIPFVAILIGLLLVTLLVITFSMNRLVIKPIEDVTKSLLHLSEGNIVVDEDSKSSSSSEIGILKESTNTLSAKLDHIISSVVNTVNSFTLATSEIADGNQNLAQRISEEASSLDSITKSVYEMNDKIDHNLSMSKNARDKSQEIKIRMSELNEKSEQMREIIKVIESISFETNLLALNAAIEAARAGEAGQGFEVVATEVKELSQRSSNQAKEIHSIIEESINSVEENMTLVESIVEITDHINESSHSQSNASKEISTAISELNELTQSNASLVQQSATSSEEIASRSLELQNVVSYFKIRESLEDVEETVSVSKVNSQ